MAHYAKVVNGIVEQVIVVDGPEILDPILHGDPKNWIQTSYNTRGNVHYGADGKPDGGVALRGNYAGNGFIYDAVNDVFYPPPPYPLWVISKDTNWIWQAPIPYPTDGKRYYWDTGMKDWVEKISPPNLIQIITKDRSGPFVIDFSYYAY